MPVFDRSKTVLSTLNYVVVAEVTNLHISGRKVLQGDEIALSAPVAAHWIAEGVIRLKSEIEAEAAAAAKSAKKATTDGAA